MDIVTELNRELKEIDKAIQYLERKRKDKRDDYGSICVKPVRGKNQYYYRMPGETMATYVPKDEVCKLRKIAQADYENRTERDLIDRRKNIKRFLRKYDKNGINSIYERMCSGRKALIEPLVKTDDSFIQEWIKKYPSGMNTYTEGAIYVTEKGENVRSKSELIIGDMLYKNCIPYQYEPRVILKNGKVFYPDFVMLNVRKRKTLFWEHLGLLSEDEYARKNFTKIIEYENEGICLGDSLIVTMETDIYPLNTKVIKEKIELFLK